MNQRRVEQRAELRIYGPGEGPDLDPEGLTRALGIEPHTVARRGDVLRSGRVRPCTVWWWQTPERREVDSEVLVREVLDKFEPVSDAIRQAGDTTKLDVVLGLIIYMIGDIQVEGDEAWLTCLPLLSCSHGRPLGGSRSWAVILTLISTSVLRTTSSVRPVLHELWDDPEGEGRYTFCLSGPRGDAARGLLSPAARLVWTVEAASHFDAMAAYYEHQGWGVYTTDQEWDLKTYAEHGWEIAGRPARGANSQAGHLTRMLRHSNEPLFARVRELLPEFGVDVGTVLLAQFFPDDGDQEFGVLVTSGRSVFTFVLYYGRRGDFKTQLRTSKIADWCEISEAWETSPYRRYVREALALPAGWDQ